MSRQAGPEFLLHCGQSQKEHRTLRRETVFMNKFVWTGLNEPACMN